jgi:hypothetical protein
VLKRLHRLDALPLKPAQRIAGKLPAYKEPRRTVDVRRGLEGLLSLPPPGGNGLDFYNTIRTHETDASVESAAIKCQTEVAGPASSRSREAV